MHVHPENHVAEAKIFRGDIRPDCMPRGVFAVGYGKSLAHVILEGAGVGFPFRVLSIYGP